MTWLLNGIVWATEKRPLDAPKHERIAGARLCALMTNEDGFDKPEALDLGQIDAPIEGALRRHDALLQAYASEQDVLPMRFGLCLKSLQDAQIVLDRHGEEFKRALDALAGRREYTIRVTRAPGLEAARTRAEAPQIGGRTYLANRLTERRDAEALRRRTDHFMSRVPVVLADFGVLRTVPKLPIGGSPRLAAWTCLIRLSRAEATCAAVATLNEEALSIGLTVTIAGPHAPFAFATLEIAHEIIQP